MQVAAYFKSLYSSSSLIAETETLVLALNVYVTNSNLAGNVATAYGFAVSSMGLGAATVNVGAGGAAFGVDNDATITTFELLLRVNLRSRKGRVWGVDGNSTLSGAETILRNKVASLFGSINNS